MSSGLDAGAVADPIGLIVRLVAEIGPGLGIERIRQVAPPTRIVSPRPAAASADVPSAT